MPTYDDRRADWKARAATSTRAVPITSRTEYFTHWNGGPLGLFGKAHAACLAEVLRMQAEHMHNDPAHGWSDIGYNALVCTHARLIEGRGVGVAGAHCPDHNTSGIGVQMMLGTGEHATPAMLARSRRFYDECSAAAGRQLAKRGHRDGFATECPGDELEAWVKAGMPAPTQGGFLMALSDQQQLDLYNRVMGGIPAGDARGRTNPDGTPARLLDSADGNYLLGFIKAGIEDPQAFADAVVTKLPSDVAHIGGDAVKQAVKDALREGIQ